jgi:hypothetical protein
MIDKNEIKRKILAACEEDHVGLWEIIRIVEQQTAESDATQVRDITLELLQELLSAGRIDAGAPAKNGRDFEAWKSPVATILTTLRNDWTSERRPTIGEVAWFTTHSQVRQTA